MEATGVAGSGERESSCRSVARLLRPSPRAVSLLCLALRRLRAHQRVTSRHLLDARGTAARDALSQTPRSRRRATPTRRVEARSRGWASMAPSSSRATGSTTSSMAIRPPRSSARAQPLHIARVAWSWLSMCATIRYAHWQASFGSDCATACRRAALSRFAHPHQRVRALMLNA